MQLRRAVPLFVVALGAHGCTTVPAPAPPVVAVAEPEPADADEEAFELPEDPVFVDEGPPPASAKVPWRWKGPSALRSTAGLPGVSPDARDALRTAARGTEVRIRSTTVGVARVTDVFGETREVKVPGSFRGVGPVRVRIDFGQDDYFEQVVTLPDDGSGPDVTVTVPSARSGALIAGARRIPVSRGVKVVTYEMDPRWDTRTFVQTAIENAGGPPFGDRVLPSGEPGTQLRQVVFHQSGTTSAEAAFRALLGRALSTHLLVERDGTIIQLLDLESCAYHAGKANQHSVGIDFVGRTENLLRLATPSRTAFSREGFDKLSGSKKAAWRETFRAEIEASLDCELETCGAEGVDVWLLGECGGPTHDAANLPALEDCLPSAADWTAMDPSSNEPDLVLPLSPRLKINGTETQAYGPSPAATRAAVAVTSALLDAFPTIPPTIPSREDGTFYSNIVPDPGDWGIVGHLHWESQRWDPGPGVDWQAFADLLLTAPRAR